MSLLLLWGQCLFPAVSCAVAREGRCPVLERRGMEAGALITVYCNGKDSAAAPLKGVLVKSPALDCL